MIVRLNGGEANQIFQYAFGRSLSIARGEELFFEKFGLDNGNHRAYSLDAFNMDVKFKQPTIENPKYSERFFKYDPGVYSALPNSHFIGCFQTERYWDIPVMRKELTLKNPVSDQTKRVADEILSYPSSVFVHVRRTDYLLKDAAAYHGNMPFEYYDKAIKYINARNDETRYFIFSDDPTWCKHHFAGCRIVDHNGVGDGTKGPSTEHEDLYLMSLCYHGIIPNSSFGWIGAWMGDEQKNRIVIAPERWFLKEGLEYSDVVPKRWVKIAN